MIGIDEQRSIAWFVDANYDAVRSSHLNDRHLIFQTNFYSFTSSKPKCVIHFDDDKNGALLYTSSCITFQMQNRKLGELTSLQFEVDHFAKI